MRLLNVGCGSVRHAEPWTNLDNLHDILKPGTPERTNLDAEKNYVNHSLPDPMPFKEGTFNAILCSHVIEHFDCQDSAKILSDCMRVLVNGGLLVVSVPNAEYFLSVYDEDKPERAVELFGEPICPDEPWHKSFFDYGLWYNQHKQILTMKSLECLMLRAGFRKSFLHYSSHPLYAGSVEPLMNRRKFSLELCAVK